MTIRLGESQETPTTKTTNPQELIEHLDSYRPFLPEKSFAVFCDMTISYLDDFPLEHPDSGDRNELLVSETSDLEESFIADNDMLTDKAIESSTEGRIKDAMRERIEDEFKACGLGKESDEIKKAFDKMESKLHGISLSLKDKQLLFSTMLGEFGSNTENLAVATADRMTKALGRLSTSILESEPVPTKKRFGKNLSGDTLAMWDKSKIGLLKKNSLPSREEILSDILVSAGASYKRSIYGDRSMVLNLGFDSDSTQQIDEFQREYYEKLDGYRIALTPEEWASEMATLFVDELLYGEDSATSQLLNNATDSSEYMKQTRESRREYSRTGNFRSKKQEDYDYKKKGYGNSHKENKEYQYKNYEKQAVKERIAQEKTKEEIVDFREGLDGPLLDAQNDIARLIDAELPDLGIKGRNKALLICNNYLRSTGARIKPEQFGTAVLKRKLVKHIISELHPDRDGGDEALCKEITQMFNNLKR